jgi:hypothetical protein
LAESISIAETRRRFDPGALAMTDSSRSFASLARIALAPLALAAAESAATARQAPVDDPRSKESTRVLHLEDGSKLRVRSRYSDERWEIRDGSEWRALEPRLVVRAVEEREVLLRARELRESIDRRDLGRRVAFAEWLMHEGLDAEALDELDRVLADDPDQSAALGLVAAPPAPIAVPVESGASVEDALRALANASPAVRERGIVELGTLADPSEVRDALREQLTSHSIRIRTLAARALRRLAPGQELRELIARAVLDGSDDVRLEAAWALRDAREEAVVIPVIRALGSSNGAVRENAIAALGDMGYPAALDPLMARLAALSAPQGGGGGWRPPAANIFVGRQFAYVQDYDVEVAQFASIADPQVNTLIEGSVLDARVVGVYTTSVAIESRRIRNSLAKLTGANPGSSNRSWLEWWGANKSRFGVRTSPTPSTPAN